jgi:hypothetical protein
MTLPSDPKEDAQLLSNIIAGLAEQGIEGFEGPTPGTLCMRIESQSMALSQRIGQSDSVYTIQFLRLEVQDYIHFNALHHPTTGALILGSDSTRRSKSAKKVLEIVSTLRYRHRILSRSV